MTNKNLHTAKIRSVQSCWVCEGWVEKRFELKEGISVSALVEPIYIHFSFEDFKPDLMVLDESTGSYFLYRMIPPGKCCYFYTINGKAVFAKVQPITRRKNPKIIKVNLIGVVMQL